MMFVFTLMGMTFFATWFRFEESGGGRAAMLSQDGAYCLPWDQCVACPDIGPGCLIECLDCVPRANFDTFGWAFVTCFQILSGENWNTVMYDGILASEARYGSKVVGVTYFIALVVFGQ